MTSFRTVNVLGSLEVQNMIPCKKNVCLYALIFFTVNNSLAFVQEHSGVNTIMQASRPTKSSFYVSQWNRSLFLKSYF